MPKVKIFLKNLYLTLLYSLPAVLFFSFYPVISLGSNASMNFELSLPLIWLVLFDITSLLVLLSLGRDNFPGITDRRIFLFSLLPFYATISISWSDNPLRGILTAGVLWAVLIAVFSILFIAPLLRSSASLRRPILAVLFVSTAAVCLFCLLQSILDTCGVDRSLTLLCRGCTYRSFGFPHPNGFAIEPQFMGNLLLAPTLTALYLLAFDKLAKYEAKSEKYVLKSEQGKSTFPQPAENSRRFFLILFASIFSFTLFFTFSRGAIYAYVIALAVLFIFSLLRHHFRPALLLIPIFTFLGSLGFQGVLAQLGPTSETFTSAITKSVHQLSLGIIDFRPTSQETETPDSDASDTYFDGYVAESTNIRLTLNQLALHAWRQTPASIIFGVGLGAAGWAMYSSQPTIQITSPKEIVQNEPLTILLELGLIGAALTILALVLIFASPSFRRHPALPLLIALLIAYFISLQFFSGLPNALHIYLMLPLLYLVLLPKTSKSSKNS